MGLQVEEGPAERALVEAEGEEQEVRASERFEARTWFCQGGLAPEAERPSLGLGTGPAGSGVEGLEGPPELDSSPKGEGS